MGADKYTSVEFAAECDAASKTYSVKNSVLKDGYAAMPNQGALNAVKVFGLDANSIASVKVTPDTSYDMAFNATSRVLIISEMALTINKPFTITIATGSL